MESITTIKEVAEYAGVSVATISRVLNNPDRVKDDTKRRVFEAIEALNYSPNLLGRNLRLAYTKTILVLLPTIANDFYSDIIFGIRKSAEQDSYNIMIGVTDHNQDTEIKYMNLLQTKSVDGVILLASTLGREYLGELSRQFPMIQCCEYVEGLEISTVTIDNYKAAYEATQYLVSLGHKHIGFVGGEGNYISSELRLQGFQDAMKAQGIPEKSEYQCTSQYSYKGGSRACEKLMGLSVPPTAIFAVADSIAVGVIKKALEKGKKIGEELDVIGFDDTAIANVYHPTVTTVAQPRFELGQNAYWLLRQTIENKISQKQVIYLPHTLKVRETTKRG
ncbi:MAG: LacI family DNA-binding transcriptional regulator [Cellulosilyticaceae bacterium]